MTSEDPATSGLRESFEAWLVRCAAQVVDSEPILSPRSDDEAALWGHWLPPRRPGAYGFGITGYSAGRVTIDVETWGRLADRLELGPQASSGAQRVAFFTEGVRLPAERLVAACEQISLGAVKVDVALQRDAIVGTAGSVQSAPPIRFSGVGASMSVRVVMARVGIGRIVTVTFDPW